MGGESIFFIQLDISASEFHHYYAQNINSVSTISHNGQRIQFPASVLQPFVTHSGVQGQFKIIIDENAKLKSILRI